MSTPPSARPPHSSRRSSPTSALTPADLLRSPMGLPILARLRVPRRGRGCVQTAVADLRPGQTVSRCWLPHRRRHADVGPPRPRAAGRVALRLKPPVSTPRPSDQRGLPRPEELKRLARRHVLAPGGPRGGGRRRPPPRSLAARSPPQVPRFSFYTRRHSRPPSPTHSGCSPGRRSCAPPCPDGASPDDDRARHVGVQRADVPVGAGLRERPLPGP